MKTVRDLEVAGLLRAGYRVVESPRGGFARRRSELVLGTALDRALRRRLFRDFDGRCFYCQIEVRDPQGEPKPRFDFVSIDHARAIARGGTWKRANLRLSCYRCNGFKSVLDELVYASLFFVFPAEKGDLHLSRIRKVARRMQAEALAEHRAGNRSGAPFSCEEVFLAQHPQAVEAARQAIDARLAAMKARRLAQRPASAFSMANQSGTLTTPAGEASLL